MKFNDKCICCGSTKDLDTVLTVTVDDEKYQVAVCDEHAEDITPKQVKVKVKAKIDEYKELVEKMKEFGVDVAPPSDGGNIAIAHKAEPAKEESAKSPAPIKRKIVLANKEGEVIMEKKEGQQARIKKNRVLPKVRSLGGVASGQVARVNLEKRGSIDATTQAQMAVVSAREKGLVKEDQEVAIPVTEEVEYQNVRGRGGRMMRIPKKIKHNVGSTKVAVVDTGGDRTIQDRFKQMADASKMTGIEGHIYGRDGYDTEPCTLCEGSGIARIGGGECKKCGGVGFVNRGWVRTGSA